MRNALIVYTHDPHRTTNGIHALKFTRPSTRANATKASIIEFTDQRFCITPPYRTTRPGMLIRPTNVAAVSCQALSPGFSHCGYSIDLSPRVGPTKKPQDSTES